MVHQELVSQLQLDHSVLGCGTVIQRNAKSNCLQTVLEVENGAGKLVTTDLQNASEQD